MSVDEKAGAGKKKHRAGRERTVKKYSVSLPEALAEEIRERVGPGEFSAYVAAAVQRQAEPVQEDARATGYVLSAQKRGGRNLCSAVTLVEAYHKGIKKGAFDYARSRVVVVPVTEEIATAARNILEAADLNGHQHAIDAMVAATAPAQPGVRLMLTSDPSDMSRLCDGTVKIVPCSE
ncbi:type II toxin-antitoxin system VapC family toxin [Actinorugispora endophytica]|uniref:Uncharacterized protein n=1 Tax=Actinorugispora endophytica TaxID=1605990 RepID=A0A4R6V6S9_9ACTN|nr:hypothetical protein [Actinorugispora endophytica]TDQ51954.1 hypothetical protein EV190_10966 [Actinorugispora endophytica]